MLPTTAGTERTRGWLTWIILVANLFVFWLELSVRHPEKFISDWGLVPRRFAQTGWMDSGILTHLFLHGGIMHILGNLWFLVVFGRKVEARIGHVRMLLIYFVGGAAAGLVHCASVPESNVPLVGASGAISALMGAAWRLMPSEPVGVWLILFEWKTRIWIFVGLWGLWQVYQAFGGLGATQTVAFFAHVGGLAVGLSVASVSGGRRAGKKKLSRKKA